MRDKDYFLLESCYSKTKTINENVESQTFESEVDVDIRINDGRSWEDQDEFQLENHPQKTKVSYGLEFEVRGYGIKSINPVPKTIQDVEIPYVEYDDNGDEKTNGKLAIELSKIDSSKIKTKFQSKDEEGTSISIYPISLEIEISYNGREFDYSSAQATLVF